MDRLIAALDQEFPGTAAAVVHREMVTARTMQRYLNTPGGAVYGFAPVRPSLARLLHPARTPVPGLWLASAFTTGGGFTGAMMGGAAAAMAAIRTSAARAAGLRSHPG